MTKLIIAFGFLALNFYTYHYLADDAVIPEREEFAHFPRMIGDWTCARQSKMQPDVERNLGVTDYLLCEYRREQEVAGVYVGYHQSQVREEGGGAGENSIHPPAHCLPGSGWDIIHNSTVILDIEGLSARAPTAKRLVIAKGDSRQLVYYWYHSRGRVISEDWRKILFVGYDRAVRGRTDGSLVRFTIPIYRGDADKADATFYSLAPPLLAQLGRFVPE